MRITLLTFIILASSTGLLFSQGDSINYKGRTSILLEIGGPEVVGAHFNVYLNNSISVNVGLGINLDVHLGSNFNFNRTKNSCFIAGIQVSSYREFIINGTSSGTRQIGVYFPLGFQYYADRGFSLRIDFGPNFTNEDWDQGNTSPILISIKIGRHNGQFKY